MFEHRSYLKLGDFSGTDFLSLAKGGYELENFEFSFQQGIDAKGKASTEVFGGSLSITIPALPSKEIIEWGLNPRKYKKGVVVLLDNEDMPQEKIFFENAACVGFGINYTQHGKAFIVTNLTVQAEHLVLDCGIDFDNTWVQ